MAPRAYWKGYLRLSLVSCPIALLPGDLRARKSQLPSDQPRDRQPHPLPQGRCRDRRGSPDRQIIKGYEVAKGEYLEITDEEIEAVALESTKTIEIDEFVPRSEIDELYNIRPYYIAPDGKVGQDAFVVIRSIIEQMKMVAIGRVVLTSREHVMAM